MRVDFLEEEKYLLAKKRVKKMKDFYTHLSVYVVVNVVLSSIIIFGLLKSGDTLKEVFSNFGVYSTWFFWGIGVFFHGIGTFRLGNLFSKDWEERKIKELMKKEEERQQRISHKA